MRTEIMYFVLKQRWSNIYMYNSWEAGYFHGMQNDKYKFKFGGLRSDIYGF